ncbi:MAG: NADP-specific glutamate dehydrogenase, partial [Clostridia bacterium]|nr:NADP-specific glutamate dehydrogenase [Clostridia bacterium]
GQYKRIKGAFENGVITGKGLSYGGSLIRPEATGYGAIYYAVEVLNHFDETIHDKTIAISGFGNVAWGVCKKAEQLGAKVITISGPDGYVLDEDGIVGEKVDYLLEMRGSGRDSAEDYVKKFPSAKFFKGEKPWNVKADIIMPCATQNEVEMADAKKIIKNKIKYYIEVSNMSTKNDALKLLKENVVVGPSKAANAGGVACSAIEMSQNSMGYNWTAEEVDAKLKSIMKNIHDESAAKAAEYGLGYDLVAGANIAGFLKVADAMLAQGIY